MHVQTSYTDDKKVFRVKGRKINAVFTSMYILHYSKYYINFDIDTDHEEP